MTDINITNIEKTNEDVTPLGIVETEEDEVDVTTEDISEQEAPKEVTQKPTEQKQNKLLRLPLNRVKNIMKFDPDCTLVSQEAAVLVTKATEVFVDWLGKEMIKYTLGAKRRTVSKRDLMTTVETIDHLCFLEGMLD